MSPLKSIISIDPQTIAWKEGGKGGGQDRNDAITKVADETLLAMKKTGAAKLTFEGDDSYWRSHSVEAYSWSQTLRRRLGEDGYEVKIKTEDKDGKTELNIAFKE